MPRVRCDVQDMMRGVMIVLAKRGKLARFEKCEVKFQTVMKGASAGDVADVMKRCAASTRDTSIDSR